MKTADKVRVLVPTFESMFPVGSEHFVHSCEGDFIYLIDPFYSGVDNDEAIWPFFEVDWMYFSDYIYFDQMIVMDKRTPYTPLTTYPKGGLNDNLYKRPI